LQKIWDGGQHSLCSLEIKSLKEKSTAKWAAASDDNSIKASNAETENPAIFKWRIWWLHSFQLKQITCRLNGVSAQVEHISEAIDEAEEYSYSSTSKLLVYQRKLTVNLRFKQGPFALISFRKWEPYPYLPYTYPYLFQEMRALSLSDTDVVHCISTGHERGGPKPVICKFIRCLAKGKVMEARQCASEAYPTSIGLSAENSLGPWESSNILLLKAEAAIWSQYIQAKNTFRRISHNFDGPKAFHLTLPLCLGIIDEISDLLIQQRKVPVNPHFKQVPFALTSFGKWESKCTSTLCVGVHVNQCSLYNEYP